MSSTETILLPRFIRIGSEERETLQLALGCWAFAGDDWGGQDNKDSFGAMKAAWERGVRHWDTAIAYGSGHSERLCGLFLQDKREEVFVSSKASVGKKPESIIRALHQSLSNLQTARIDLYYLHYPKSGVDMRPHMELLRREKEKGLIGAIGVSNFSLEEMESLREVGEIDVCQIGYSLLWRKPDADVLPYCRRHGIRIVTHSSIGQGILTGKFSRETTFREDDVRSHSVLFDPQVWPRIHPLIEEMEAVVLPLKLPLHHLAIQWNLRQPGIAAAVIGSRSSKQSAENFSALDSRFTEEAFSEVTAISDRLQAVLPDETNLFRYYP